MSGKRSRHTPRGTRTPRVPLVRHQPPARPAPPTGSWLDRPPPSKFRRFCKAVEIALWISAGLSIVIAPGDLGLALALAALAVGLVLAPTDKRPRY